MAVYATDEFGDIELFSVQYGKYPDITWRHFITFRHDGLDHRIEFTEKQRNKWYDRRNHNNIAPKKVVAFIKAKMQREAKE